jgi:transcriptional regulator with XRE-family HTH domain
MPNNHAQRSRFRAAHGKSQWRESLMAVMQPSQDQSSKSEINVGRRLQELRISQGLSLRSLAEISGLNFNTLSLIENEKSSPNVNTLQQLASALQVPITAFFEGSSSYKDVVYQKYGQRPRTSFPHGELEDLGGGLALGEATPLLMTAKPGTNSGPESIVHTGQEFVFCLEGSMTYQVSKEEYTLNRGDSILFQAHIPHRWENRFDGVTCCLLIICPSDHADRSVEQHLHDKLEVMD